MRPRLLDLYCGAGGAAVGFHRAGFEVVGVDINPQPNYPFEFVRGDALGFLHGSMLLDLYHFPQPLEMRLATFAAIHASPPCQGYSDLGKDDHPRLIGPTRELLEESGLPWIIENIEDARSEMNDPVMLCGTMFDPILDVRRHRLFEANWSLRYPDWPCRHSLSDRRFDVYEHGAWRKRRFVPVYGKGGGKADEHWASAMGIDWMTREELKEAIPPRYTEFIGQQLLAHVQVAV